MELDTTKGTLIFPGLFLSLVFLSLKIKSCNVPNWHPHEQMNLLAKITINVNIKNAIMMAFLLALLAFGLWVYISGPG